MIEIPGIQQGGLSEISPELPQSRRREEMIFDRKGKPTKLRPGEIVQGTILDVHSNEEATVRLPNGTYRAVLHGSLKRGDTLFFKVAESVPSLVLKIYAVYSVIDNKKVPVNDIIRILDLPEKPLTNELITLYSSRRSIIVRDDVLVFFRLFEQMEDQEIEKTPLRDIFKVIFLMQESDLPFSVELYRKIKPLFIGMNYLQAALTLLDQYKYFMPDPLQKRLEKLFSGLKDPETSLLYLFRFFGMQPPDKNTISLYSILRQFLNISYNPRKQPEMYNLQSIVRNLVAAIEAQYIMNAFAIRNNTPLYFFVPIYIWENYYVSQLTVRPRKDGSTQFTLLTFNEKLGEVLTQGTYNNNKLFATFISESESTCQIIQKHLMALRRVLYSKNYDVESLKTSKVPLEEISLLQESTQQQPKKISVVI